MINFNEIQSFLEIVRVNSLSAAAANLYLTQSTISKQLNLLENELGVTLFERGKGRKCNTLTEEGKKFLMLARQWQSLYHDTTTLTEHAYGKRLRFAANTSIYSTYLKDVLVDFLAEQNNVALSCFSSHSSVAYQKVAERKIEFAFVSNALQRSGISVSLVLEEPFCLVTSCFSGGLQASVQLEYLKPANEVFFYWDDTFTQWHERVLGPITSTYAYVEDIDTLLRMVEQRCWTFFPRSVWNSLSAAERCNFIAQDVAFPMEPRSVYLIRRNDCPFSEEALTFLEILYDRLWEIPHIRLNPDFLPVS